MKRRDMLDVSDITFIGAGPTGLFGAFYAGMREMSVKIIDSLPQPGGQLTALYPEKQIFDVPGHPAILSRQLVANLFEQAMRWKPVICLEECCLHLRRVLSPDEREGGECWLLETDRGVHYSRTIVIAAGIGAFQPLRLPDESIQYFEDKGVLYLVKDPHTHTGERVLIVGGGDSAVDWTLALEPIAARVTLIHRREGFRAHDASIKTLKSSSVDVKVFYELRRLEGRERVKQAVIFDNRTQAEEILEVDTVILALGYRADLGSIQDWDLEIIGHRYIKVNHKMETNLPGIYAAGDIALKEGLDPLNLIVVGFGEVTVAVNYAYTVVKPGGKVFPGRSSMKMTK